MTSLRQLRKKKGFVLMATILSITGMLGVVCLVVDLGRAYVAQNEVQAFTDSAALAGALKLDGTLVGIQSAKTAVAANTNKWYFATKSVTSVTTEFSTDLSTWTNNPSVGLGYKYVRVKAPTNNLGTTFGLVMKNAKKIMNVGATSIAGLDVPNSFGQGVFPFAPFAHSLTGPDFGYVKGDELTLLWPSSVQSNGNAQQLSNLCAIDKTQAWLNLVKNGQTSDRGYIQETSAAAIAAAIEDDKVNYTVTLGEDVNLSGGVKTTDVYQSLNDRVNQDSSSSQDDIDNYITGHDASAMRRIVIVPIIKDHVTPTVLGFAKVLLPHVQPHNPNKSKCAYYIGPASTPTGNSANGSGLLRLLQ